MRRRRGQFSFIKKGALKNSDFTFENVYQLEHSHPGTGRLIHN